MFAHRFTVRAGQFRSQRANALIQLLNLRFAKDRAWRLVLEPVHKCREQVDVFHLHGRQLVLIVRFILSGRCTRRSLLLQLFGVYLLLLFHVLHAGSDRRLQIRIFLILVLRSIATCNRRLRLRLLRYLGLRHVSRTRVALGVF